MALAEEELRPNGQWSIRASASDARQRVLSSWQTPSPWGHGGRVERRLAAVLAAEVAGYSRLMGADEVGTLKTPAREANGRSDRLGGAREN
jgi:hypothetical protein